MRNLALIKLILIMGATVCRHSRHKTHGLIMGNTKGNWCLHRDSCIVGPLQMTPWIPCCDSCMIFRETVTVTDCYNLKTSENISLKAIVSCHEFNLDDGNVSGFINRLQGNTFSSPCILSGDINMQGLVTVSRVLYFPCYDNLLFWDKIPLTSLTLPVALSSNFLSLSILKCVCRVCDPINMF